MEGIIINCSEMKILVLGSGGREHALCWKLAQSPGAEVYATPGNPGVARVATCLQVKDSTPNSFLDAALAIHADLTVVGPEAPLVAGVVDLFRAHGLRIVGPDRAAARLEASKIFAKNFFTQRRIPTARFAVAETPSEARNAVDRFDYPVVLKADGLAAGKAS
jgi:phosphoribosylamine--glycine ligase